MPVFMIRYQVPDEGLAAVTDAVKAAFAALEEEQPPGLRFSYYRRADSSELVGLLELDEGVENPLPGIAAARQLQVTVAKWAGDAPTRQPLDLLGSYGCTR
jgi:hypothetical protein